MLAAAGQGCRGQGQPARGTLTAQLRSITRSDSSARLTGRLLLGRAALDAAKGATGELTEQLRESYMALEATTVAELEVRLGVWDRGFDGVEWGDLRRPCTAGGVPGCTGPWSKHGCHATACMPLLGAARLCGCAPGVSLDSRHHDAMSRTATRCLPGMSLVGRRHNAVSRTATSCCADAHVPGWQAGRGSCHQLPSRCACRDLCTSPSTTDASTCSWGSWKG